jgi:CheY-like chemotaxis protein
MATTMTERQSTIPGFRAVSHVCPRRPTQDIPVVMCTAAVQAVREMEGYLLAQGVGIVLKPFRIDDLVMTVRKTMRLPNAIAENGNRAET